tara:strand:- start:2218 stop:4854 length:2637 start_codon:yes stop_codon:yes gene_type:complete
MKKVLFFLLLLFTGCSTLGLGDFEEENKKLTLERLNSNSDKIPVIFKYQPLIGGKHNVFIAGDFNNWSPNRNPLSEKDGLYTVTLYLKRGKYSYKFVVDGNWITDENAEDFIDDGFGGENSIIYIGDKNDIDALRKVDFIYQPQNIVKEIYLVGSMNDWNQKSHRMFETTKGTYSTSILLKEGSYQYKFLEDGINWIADENAEIFEEDGFGGKNSVINVNNNFEKVLIKKGDGIFLNYGISTSQNIETINPLSSTKIEFKTKAHKGDLEKIFLLKDDELLLMDKIAEDGSFEYYQKTIDLNNPNEEFMYCFVYQDGNKKQYLLNGGFSNNKEKANFFHYSQNKFIPFLTPDWVKNGVIYQIFPERFNNGDKMNDPDFSEWYYEGINIPPMEGKLLNKYTQYFHTIEDWYDISGLVKSPYHAPDNDGYQPEYNSFYGGDIAGVKQKLDYLEDLGITIIYFNPIFEAKSNHKYDAANYMKVDPHFGTNEDFRTFVDEAHKRGIRIIIDCAFNHTGETYFAFQEGMKYGPESHYYDWYEWLKWPLPNPQEVANYKPADYYRCWWGYGEMPDLNYDLNEINPSENAIKDINQATPNWDVVNHILDIAEFWISDMDIDGFRLDVPNEVPFWFWELFRDKVKSIKPDAYLVGELWSNAIDWVNDDYFDAVMNYAYFKDPVMRFFNMRQCDAKDFDRDLKPGLLSYPSQSTQVMMNLIDSHDTFRYLESCDGDISRLKMAVLFQMTYVGAPHIWYGDEIGMMGAHDPDCRRPFEWNYIENVEKVNLRDYYKKLIHLRKKYTCLRTGSFQTLIADGMVYGYLRMDNNNSIAVLINNDTKSNKISLPFENKNMVDLLTGKEYSIKDGFLEIDIDSMSGMVLKLEKLN